MNQKRKQPVQISVCIKQIGDLLVMAAGVLLLIWISGSAFIFSANEQRRATGRPELECYSTPADSAIAMSVLFAQLAVGIKVKSIGKELMRKEENTV